MRLCGAVNPSLTPPPLLSSLPSPNISTQHEVPEPLCARQTLRPSQQSLPQAVLLSPAPLTPTQGWFSLATSLPECWSFFVSCLLFLWVLLLLQTLFGTKNSFSSAEHPKGLLFEDRTPLGAPALISGQTRLQSLWNNLERSERSVALTREIKSPLLIVYLSRSKTFTLDPFQSLSFLKQNCSKA